MHDIPNTIYRHQIRQLIRRRRRTLTIEQQYKFSHQAISRLLIWPWLLTAHNIALFLSIDGELDTRPLIEQLWHIGKKIYLPVIYNTTLDSKNLLFLQYSPHTRLVLNKFNIYEPELNFNRILPLNEIEVLITPLVAFDRNGQRLGMGGGFYDRILKNWQQYNFQPIGYAHDCQLVDSLPSEEWDIPLPAVVTPSKLWLW